MQANQRHSNRLAPVVTILAGTVMAWPSLAITTGSLYGTVKDSAGKPLQGASVRVDSAALLGGERTIATDDAGFYRFPALPPGVYKIVVTYAGLQTSEKEDAFVGQGGTATFDAVLVPRPVELSVEVSAREGVIDPERTATVTTLDKELIERLPTLGRHYSDLLMVAPGIVNNSDQGSSYGRQNPNSHGARADANQYYFDGGDSTNGTTGVWGPRFNMDAIAQMEILTSGESAEFGKGDGAIANILTKSGGNEFEGSFRFDDQEARFDRWGSGKEQYKKSGVEFHRRYYSATFGGPILKDRAWFFLSQYLLDDVEPIDFTGSGTGPYLIQTQSSLLHDTYAKLSYQINDDHQLVFSFHQDPSIEHNARADSVSPPETQAQYVQKGNYFQLRETAVLSPTLLIESMAYVVTGRETRLEPDSDAPSSTSPWSGENDDTRLLIGPFNQHQRITDNRNQLKEDLSYFVGDFHGTHDLRVGVGYERDQTAYEENDAPFYFLRGGIPYKKIYHETAENLDTVAHSEQRYVSAYAQDAWSPRPGLTFNLGLRADYDELQARGLTGLDQFLVDPGFRPEDRQTTDRNFSHLGLSPRLGFTWDPAGNGKSLIRGSVGRYYHPYLGYLGQLERDSLINAGYGCNTDSQGNCIDGTVIRDIDNFVDPHLTLPHTDEVTLGYDRELWPEAAAGATVILRQARGLFGDRDLNSIYVDADNNGFPEKKVHVNPNFNYAYLYGNYDRSDYGGLEVTFRKRLGNHWQFLGSYTYSVAKGDSEIYYSADSEDPRRQKFSYSYLPYDQRHVVKLDGSYFLPLGFVVSGSGRYFTGTPYSIFVDNFIDANGNGIYDLGERDGPDKTYYDQKNSHRNPSYYNLDLRIDKEFRIKGTILGVFASALNALNDQSVINTFKEVYPYDSTCDPTKSSCHAPGDTYLREVRRFGVRFQFGLTFTFGGAREASPRVSSREMEPLPAPPRETATPLRPTEPPKPALSKAPTAESEPSSGTIQAPTFAPKRRTFVGTIVAIDAASKRLSVDMGLDRVTTVLYGDGTKIEGGPLGVGKRVRVHAPVDRSSTRVATSINVLD